MTASARVAPGRYAVRVMVTDAWDQVYVAVEPETRLGELKRQALERALKRPARSEEYVIKFRGALVTDESMTLESVGAGANAPFIVLPARRRPLR